MLFTNKFIPSKLLKAIWLYAWKLYDLFEGNYMVYDTFLIP